ncbi:MAG TPA: hypothetical protein VJ888_09715, partial [Mobilitalea sp.]|nr:hypothetical protein [Mobilitalea sp.]
MTMNIKEGWKQRRKSLKTVMLISSFVIFAIIFFFPTMTQAAEASITVKEINYQNSTITLQVYSDDSIIYFSDSLKRTWEIVPGNIKSDRTIVMDISWVSLIKNYVMTFKGNSSSGITTVVLPKQVTNFKASFNKVKGTISFKNVGRRTIEWRKKDSMIWNTVNIDTISTELGYFYTNGATIYFRLAPVNGSGSDNLGYRASKEIAVNIPKKIAAPSVKINGSKLNITAKKGIAYRIVNMDGSVSDWITLRSSTDLLLSDIASRALYSNNAASQEEVTLQFRSNATSTAQVSNIATIIVPIQEGQPDEDRQGISLAYSSSTTLSLQVKAASSTNPFEYTIIKQNSELSYKTAKWTAITSSAPISIKKNTAPQGSHIYIRKKSIEASEEIDFSLASAEKDITGANGIAYPEAPTTSTIKTLITTAGVCKEDNGSGTLTFTLYSPTATTVSTIDIYDVYGNMKGSVTSKSSVSVNNNSTGYNDKYIITTKITSTSSIDTHTN